jgi:hypothetical protein
MKRAELILAFISLLLAGALMFGAAEEVQGETCAIFFAVSTIC